MFGPGKNEIHEHINICIQRYQAGDKNALDDVYDHISQFCLRVISKTCGKYINSDDEEAAIIPHVILDVLDKYNPDRGSFMVYLGQAIRNRTIDGLRKEKRHPSIALSQLDTDILSAGIEAVFYEDIIDDMARKQEIKVFEELLANFDLNFEVLANVSPRQSKTREQAQRVALLIAQDSELSAYLITKGMLPHKLLEERFYLNRNILDRYRKYIIAAVLIHVHDLEYLKPYVLPAPREGEPWLESKVL